MYNSCVLLHRNLHMQSRFRTATFSIVGGADSEQFSVGAENVHYEGPLQIQLQVNHLPVLTSEWQDRTQHVIHQTAEALCRKRKSSKPQATLWLPNI